MKMLRVSTKFSLKFIPKGPINNIPALVQIMAWRRLGDKPLSEPMMDSLPTHICVTRPQWVKVIHIIGPELRKFDQKRLRILKSYIYIHLWHTDTTELHDILHNAYFSITHSVSCETKQNEH